MSSIKSKLVEAALKLVQKRGLTSEKQINRYIASHLSYTPHAKHFRNLNITENNINDYPCFVIKNKEYVNDKKIIYIHGGAFILEISFVHWDFIDRLANKTHATIYVPIYPLSTANRSALEDDYKLLNKIYKELLKSNDSANITLMGDSAGGNMALVMAQQLKLAKLPKPCKIILISPPVDFGTNSIIAKQLADHDPVLPWKLLEVCLKWYLRNDDPNKPIYSPTYGDSHDIGMITIFVGDNEGFYAQIEQYHKNLLAHNIPHNFVVGKEMFHVYPIFNMREGEQALNQIENIINHK